MSWFKKKKVEEVVEPVEVVKDPCNLSSGVKYAFPEDYFVVHKLPIIIIEETHHHILWMDDFKTVHHHKLSTSNQGNYFKQVREGVYTLSELSSIKDFIV